MKLSDFVVREAILVDLQATGKEEAIREIVKSLRDAGQVAEGPTWKGSSAPSSAARSWAPPGSARGVAVPHTRHPTVQKLVGTVALSRHGASTSRPSTATRSTSSSS